MELYDKLGKLIRLLTLDGSVIGTDKNWNDLDVNKVCLVSGTYKKSLNAPIDGNLTGMWYYVKISDNLNCRICNKSCLIFVSHC